MDGGHRQREYAEHSRRTQAAQARAYAQQMQQQQQQQQMAQGQRPMETRYDPTPSRAAGGMMGAPVSSRRVHFDPALEGSRQAVPRPVPPRLDRATGLGAQMTPADDPPQGGARDEHLAGESAGEPGADPALMVVTRALQTLLVCLLVASVFALPERARVVWLVVAAHATLAAVGACLYDTALRASQVQPWMNTALQLMLALHAAVVVAVVATAAWRVYKTMSPGAPGADEQTERRTERRSRRARRVRINGLNGSSAGNTPYLAALAPEYTGTEPSKKPRRGE